MVTHFKIHANFHEYLEGRCPHNMREMDSDGVKDMSDKLIPLLRQLKPGALRSFWYISLQDSAAARVTTFKLTKRSWDLGSCVSEDILGVDGHLQREQPNIESLSLSTGTPTTDGVMATATISPHPHPWCLTASDIFESSPGQALDWHRN